jgi:hypothetical protein
VLSRAVHDRLSALLVTEVGLLIRVVEIPLNLVVGLIIYRIFKWQRQLMAKS